MWIPTRRTTWMCHLVSPGVGFWWSNGGHCRWSHPLFIGQEWNLFPANWNPRESNHRLAGHLQWSIVRWTGTLQQWRGRRKVHYAGSLPEVHLLLQRLWTNHRPSFRCLLHHFRFIFEKLLLWIRQPGLFLDQILQILFQLVILWSVKLLFQGNVVLVDRWRRWERESSRSRSVHIDDDWIQLAAKFQRMGECSRRAIGDLLRQMGKREISNVGWLWYSLLLWKDSFVRWQRSCIWSKMDSTLMTCSRSRSWSKTWFDWGTPGTFRISLIAGPDKAGNEEVKERSASGLLFLLLLELILLCLEVVARVLPLGQDFRGDLGCFGWLAKGVVLFATIMIHSLKEKTMHIRQPW